MPIGIQRLNDRHPQPSSQIVFIKPLKGPDESYAKDFLERIAAICHPIMKANHLSVMTLEEHEANTEFVGRNFNAGEIIQLVLKSHRTGQWLSFRTVQLVMIHEMAHIMQMNHSKKFWQVRNQYAVELRALWQKGYTGDGMWGRGRTLLSGRYDSGGRPEEDQLPPHLCGGVYRRYRRRKRKQSSALGNRQSETYAEKKQRRIEKKFGREGQSLGGDLDTRATLENGQMITAKPRVANSSRGRELRIAAALARFDGQKQEPSKTDALKSDEEFPSGSATSDEDEESDEVTRICGNENLDDENIKQELDDLRDTSITHATEADHGDSTTDDDEEEAPVAEHQDVLHENPDGETNAAVVASSATHDENIRCEICSMDNASGSTICMACSHVLDKSRALGTWSCRSDACIGSRYINAGDCGICGVCGRRKPEPS